ncbi:1-aminocyclopropane-1-carboxylate deaminase [compost metagenome]
METEVEKRGDYWFKRDDQFEMAGVRGGKVRSCWNLAQGAKGLVTAGSKQSPQVQIVAHVAAKLGIPCRVHVPWGNLSPELESAKSLGAEIVQAKPGFNSIIISRAKKDAKELGWTEIPFGMECEEAIVQTALQVQNIPLEVERVVVPVGSGMSLCGILHGLKNRKIDIPVIGIQVGADPTKRLIQYAPVDIHYELLKSDLPYHERYPSPMFQGIELDPIYEAKCIPFLKPNDLLWIVGIRKS